MILRERIQTAVVVSFAAILVWLYAEAQNPAQPVRTELSLQIRAPHGSNWRVRQGSATNINLLITGSTGELRNLERDLSNEPIRVALGEHGIRAEAGRFSEPTVPLLERLPIFAERRVRLRDAEPTVIEYTVDRVVEQTLEVDPAPFESVEVEGAIDIDPLTVILRLPEAMLDSTGESSLRVVATPRLESLNDLRPGERYTVDGALSVPGIADQSLLEFTPTRVRMSFTVRSTRAETTKLNVPVHFVIPPLDQGLYSIEIEEAIIPELRLAGPNDLIEQVDRGDVRITAQLLLSSDDLATGVTEKEVSFSHLPDGLEVISDPIIAQISITRRDALGGE